MISFLQASHPDILYIFPSSSSLHAFSFPFPSHLGFVYVMGVVRNTFLVSREEAMKKIHLL
jgi:hypothetical protein